jgi:N6-adenosine-specific RNA methylase IME4
MTQSSSEVSETKVGSKSLLAVIPKSIPEAKRALAVMERDVEAVKTYEAIRKIERVADALRLLFADVQEIRESAERVITVAKHRIAKELEAVPKATASGKGQKRSQKRTGNNKDVKSGRAGTGIPPMTRSRLGKIGNVPLDEVKAIIASLHSRGKPATEAAILRELKAREIKQARAAYEERADKGANIGDLEAMAEAGKIFSVIYADPPWEFKVYSGEGKQRSAERHYNTSSLEAIKALPIERIAAKDCALFLWSVWPELPGAIAVIKSWGFEYKTCGFLWVKTVSETNAALFTGMGYWTRANSEPCLFATRGAPQRHAMDVPQVILAPVGEHSVKPEEARKRIERLLLGPYLELFGRRLVSGWTVWGNEVEPVLEAAE